MCRFIKNRKDRGKKKKVRTTAVGVSVMNRMLGVLILFSLAVYAIIAVGNTSQNLTMGALEKDLTEQINRKNTFTVLLTEQRSSLLTEQQLSRQGLVKVERVEYGGGKEGEVAIR